LKKLNILRESNTSNMYSSKLSIVVSEAAVEYDVPSLRCPKGKTDSSGWGTSMAFEALVIKRLESSASSKGPK